MPITAGSIAITLLVSGLRDALHMGSATCGVINEDRIAPPHRLRARTVTVMEIVSYVLARTGHRDSSLGNDNRFGESASPPPATCSA